MKKIIALLIVAAITIMTATTAFADPSSDIVAQAQSFVSEAAQAARDAEAAVVTVEPAKAAAEAARAAAAASGIKNLMEENPDISELKGLFEQAAEYAAATAESAKNAGLAFQNQNNAQEPVEEATPVEEAAPVEESAPVTETSTPTESTPTPAAGAGAAAETPASSENTPAPAPAVTPVAPNSAKAQIANSIKVLTDLGKDFPELKSAFDAVNAALAQCMELLPADIQAITVPVASQTVAPTVTPANNAQAEVPAEIKPYVAEVNKYVAEAQKYASELSVPQDVQVYVADAARYAAEAEKLAAEAIR